MKPTLFSIGELHFSAYTIGLALAFLIGVLLPVRRNYQLARPYPITPIGGIWVFIGAILGSKIYWHIQYAQDQPWYHMFYLWQGGLVFYGGLAGGAIGAILYLKAVGAPLLPVGDITMPFVPLAHAVARVGCFLNGCCWGGVTSAPWGVEFPRNSHPYLRHLHDHLIDQTAAASLPVHPVQLYESGGLLLIFAVMLAAARRNRVTGTLVFLYPLLYGILRFIIEFFRGDSHRPIGDLFTASQVVAAGLIVFGVLGILVLRALPRSEALPVSEGEKN